MEEKERYQWSQDVIVECAYEDYDYIVDTENNIIFNDDNYFKLIDLLNQQDKRIKELKESEVLIKALITGIDLIMHDKDYRFKNDDGTWYSRKSCKNITNEEVYEEIIDEIQQLDNNYGELDDKNQQLKQQLAEKDKEIEFVKNMKAYEMALEVIKKGNQDKISFAIEQLEKVKEYTEDVWWVDGVSEVVCDFIDKQINELKGEK